MQGYEFSAKPEELRKPRIVRVSSTIFNFILYFYYEFQFRQTEPVFAKQVAAVQNSIVRPTTDPINVQRDAIHIKIQNMIEAAAASNVNIICLQEAWSK